MNRLRKYVYIYKSELMSTLQYIFNILFDMLGYVILIFIFFNLWNYIYDDPSQLINGYSKNQMIWYVILTEIIWGATKGRRFCKKICDDVKCGNIAYQMNKPYSYISYVLASHLGETTIKTVISVIVGIVLGIIFLGKFPSMPAIGIVIVLISSILAVVINSLFTIFIGLFSFIIEDAMPLYWVYSKLILILGTIFPVEFFPGALGQIIRVSPIYVTCYGPAKLFVDFSYEKAVKILIAQLIYIVIAGVMCYTLYGKGVKKLNVNGG